jgi:hypothetical protein
VSKAKEKDLVNYVVTGSRYQVMNEKGEAIPEFGVGLFRSGIHLDVAIKLYVEMVANGVGVGSPWNGQTKAIARQLAATAFALSEVFLDEMDKHLRRPPPPPPEDNPASVRK